MRGRFLAVLAAPAAGVKSLHEVIPMLEKMLKDGEVEIKDRNKVYDDEACECKERLTALAHDFQSQQDDLTKQRDRSSTLEQEIKEVVDELNDYLSKKITDADPDEIKTKNLKFLMEGIRDDKTNLAKEQTKCNKAIKESKMMIAACDKVVDILHDKKKIVKLVRTLRDRALARQAELQTGEGSCGATIRQLQKDISMKETAQKIAFENSDRLTGVKEAKNAAKDEADKKVGQLEAAQKKTKDDLTKKDDHCKETKTNFDEEAATLATEVKGLKTAIEVLKKVPMPASFIQTAVSVERRDEEVEKTLSFIATTALVQHSPALAALSLRIRSQAKKKDAADFFVDVRKMIKDMVSKLEGEAEAEATREETCKKQLAEALKAKQSATVDLDQTITELKNSQMELKDLNGELAEKTATMNKAMDDLAQTKANMAESLEFNNALRNDKEAGIEGLKAALVALKEAYGDANQGKGASENRNNQGGSIIGKLNNILEEFQCDFARSSAAVVCSSGDSWKYDGSTYECTADAKLFEGRCEIAVPETQSQKTDIADLEKDIGRDDEPLSGYNEDVFNLNSDIDGVKEDIGGSKNDKKMDTKKLSSASDDLSAVQKLCVNQADQFKARVQAREQEIQALKDALEILESHSKNDEKFMFLAKK